MSLRLLYVANAQIPGPRAHSIQIERSCAAFADAGAEIELWIPQRRGRSGAVPAAKYPIRRLASFDSIDLFPAGLQRPAFLFQSWSFARSVHRGLADRHDFDFLYVRDPYSLVWLGGLPKVYEAHGLPRRARSVERLRHALGGAAAVIALNPYLAQRYAELGVDPRRVATIPAAASGESAGIERATARHELGIDADRRVVCYAGTLSAAKGVNTLLAAARDLPDDWLLLLVGGDAREQVWARRRIADPKIRLDPRVPPPEVARYLAAADVLVLPNSARDPASSLWTSPMKLFEYDQADRPIVLSSVDALRAAAAELPADASLNWFPPDDPAALARALIRASETPRPQRAPRSDGWRRRAERILEHLQAVKSLS